MNKAEILKTIESYLDSIESRDWTEWPKYFKMYYLEFYVQSHRHITEKYKLKEWDEITDQMRNEAQIFMANKFDEHYDYIQKEFFNKQKLWNQ